MDEPIEVEAPEAQRIAALLRCSVAQEAAYALQHGPEDARIERHAVAGNVGGLVDVRAATQRDVGLHALHAEHFGVANERGVFVVGAAQDFTRDAAVADLHQRRRAGASDGAHEFDGEIIRDVDGVDEDAVTFVELRGVLDEEFGELRVTRICHSSGAARLTGEG